MENNLQVGYSLIKTSDLIDLVIEKKEIENKLLDAEKEVITLKNTYKKMTDKYLRKYCVENSSAEKPEDYFYSWDFIEIVTEGIPYEVLEKYVQQNRIVKEQENDGCTED